MTVATIALALALQVVSTVPLGRFSRAMRWRAWPPIVVNVPATYRYWPFGETSTS